MKDYRNLQGIDAAWIAADASGFLAIFTTGGEGPVPDTAMLSIESAEESVLYLPETTWAELLVTIPRPDSFIAFAKRGLFAYDWSDVHRTARQVVGGYELQARPAQPLLLTDLPQPLQVMATATKLSGVSFGTSIVVPAEWVGT